MAQEIIMPKLGNTVESVVIVEWKKDVGDDVAQGEALCEVETDKTTQDVEAEIAGTLLARLYEKDDEVDVLKPFAVIGEPGEEVSVENPVADIPAPDSSQASPVASPPASSPEKAVSHSASGSPSPSHQVDSPPGVPGISPRARTLAASQALADRPETGSGPGGRIIERDIQSILNSRPALTVAAKAAGLASPPEGSGIGGRVTASDVADFNAKAAPAGDKDTEIIRSPVQGIRKIIADRMHASLAETAQLTLHSSVTASSLQAWRSTFKKSSEKSVFSSISINDLLMYTVSRVLPRHPELNASFHGTEIRRYPHVNLGFAVDTSRGLMVPVIRHADALSLSELSTTIKRLADACRRGNASPDELSGGTFTVTNLGGLGIENFTPIINTPQVAILGVGCPVNSPIEKEDGSIGLEKRMSLSLTIDHQAVDGAPGARFLQDLVRMLSRLELAMAL